VEPVQSDVAEPFDDRFRPCGACGEPKAFYLPPWARGPETRWNVHIVDETVMWSAIAYCAFCKAAVAYAVPRHATDRAR